MHVILLGYRYWVPDCDPLAIYTAIHAECSNVNPTLQSNRRSQVVLYSHTAAFIYKTRLPPTCTLSILAYRIYSKNNSRHKFLPCIIKFVTLNNFFRYLLCELAAQIATLLNLTQKSQNFCVSQKIPAIRFYTMHPWLIHKFYVHGNTHVGMPQ